MEYGIGNITGLIPKLDIGYAVSLLGDVYGFNSPVYLPYSRKREFEARGYILPDAFKNDTINGYSGIEIIKDEDLFSGSVDRLSMFGTPILGSFTLAGGEYLVFDEYTGKLVTREYADFEFPVASIVTFTREKNIIKTPMLGGHGTVKEIFGFDDWQIQIDGIIFNDPSRKTARTVHEQKQKIQEFDEIAGAIDLFDGNVFIQRKIRRIVIEDIRFNPIQGKPKIMPYSIKACSDRDVLLTGLI